MLKVLAKLELFKLITALYKDLSCLQLITYLITYHRWLYQTLVENEKQNLINFEMNGTLS